MSSIIDFNQNTQLNADRITSEHLVNEYYLFHSLLYSDKDATIYINWSSDGSNADYTDIINLSATIGGVYRSIIKGRFMSIKYECNPIDYPATFRCNYLFF